MRQFFAYYKKFIFIFTVIVIIAFTACTPQKKLIYLQQKAQDVNAKDTNVYKGNSPNYKLRANDLIYIKINSIDPASFDFFNGGSSNSMNGAYQYQSEVGVYLNSYTIDENGFINLPVAGMIKIVDLTINEAQTIIQKSVDKYLKDASVIVKLTSFRVTIIGDVERPGQYYFYQDKVNIFEALSKAGDLTAYGNRFRVMIVRKSKDGDKVMMVNLTDRDLLNKEEFYVLPNDIVYIEPNKVAKTLQFATFPWSIVLSTISTIVTVYALLRK
jgi:polysaccharide export outer membrane protein